MNYLGKIILLIVIVFVIALVTSGLRTYSLIKKGNKLATKAVSFQKINPEADFRILVAGDSTAVGTGTENNINSTAGRLSKEYPDAELVNISENGLKLGGLNAELKERNLEKFDIAVAQIGANDIIRFTSLADIEKELDTLLNKLSTFSDKVVILHSGDIGEAPLFPWYIKPFLSQRTKSVREIYKNKVTDYDNIKYVDLIAGDTGQIFAQKPELYYATDGLHLSGEGYKLWFEEILKKIKSFD